MPTHHNSRKYPRILTQLEKIHESSPSARDEAQFPCIACSAIPCSQYNTKGDLICLMEFQRVPKNIIPSLEWHWCHQRNVKLLSTFSLFQLYWTSCYSLDTSSTWLSLGLGAFYPSVCHAVLEHGTPVHVWSLSGLPLEKTSNQRILNKSTS